VFISKQGLLRFDPVGGWHLVLFLFWSILGLGVLRNLATAILIACRMVCCSPCLKSLSGSTWNGQECPGAQRQGTPALPCLFETSASKVAT